jgi:hypothetical protein
VKRRVKIAGFYREGLKEEYRRDKKTEDWGGIEAKR